MQFLKNTVKDIQTKFNINKCVAEATSPSKLSVKYEDADPVILLAREHPQLVVQAISDRLVYDGYVSTTTFLSIQLLEAVVNSSSYTFHTVLADHKVLRSQIVDFACIGGDNNTCRAVKGAAKKLVLEFSRMFADDDRLVLLSRLAESVERRSGKDLLRSIMLEATRVKIRSPKEGDFIPISPIKRPKGSSGPRFPPAPWACPGCQFTNKAKQLRCVVCNGPKPKKKPMPQLALDDEEPQVAASAATSSQAPSTGVLQGSIVRSSPESSHTPSDGTSTSEAGPSPSIVQGAVVIGADVVIATEEGATPVVVESADNDHHINNTTSTGAPIEEDAVTEAAPLSPEEGTLTPEIADDATEDYITEHKVADQVKAALHDNAEEEEARLERQRVAEEAERKEMEMQDDDATTEKIDSPQPQQEDDGEEPFDGCQEIVPASEEEDAPAEEAVENEANVSESNTPAVADEAAPVQEEDRKTAAEESEENPIVKGQGLVSGDVKEEEVPMSAPVTDTENLPTTTSDAAAVVVEEAVSGVDAGSPLAPSPEEFDEAVSEEPELEETTEDVDSTRVDTEEVVAAAHVDPSVGVIEEVDADASEDAAPKVVEEQPSTTQEA